MKTIKLKAVTYEMLFELSGKSNLGDVERWLDGQIKQMYQERKK